MAHGHVVALLPFERVLTRRCAVSEPAARVCASSSGRSLSSSCAIERVLGYVGATGERERLGRLGSSTSGASSRPRLAWAGGGRGGAPGAGGPPPPPPPP